MTSSPARDTIVALINQIEDEIVALEAEIAALPNKRDPKISRNRAEITRLSIHQGGVQAFLDAFDAATRPAMTQSQVNAMVNLNAVRHGMDGDWS
jgi:hypothetical protein